ncbi:MAG: hypothetical protein NVS3B12_11770 [Acidimicrobiales bacterium]
MGLGGTGFAAGTGLAPTAGTADGVGEGLTSCGNAAVDATPDDAVVDPAAVGAEGLEVDVLDAAIDAGPVAGGLLTTDFAADGFVPPRVGATGFVAAFVAVPLGPDDLAVAVFAGVGGALDATAFGTLGAALDAFAGFTGVLATFDLCPPVVDAPAGSAFADPPFADPAFGATPLEGAAFGDAPFGATPFACAAFGDAPFAGEALADVAPEGRRSADAAAADPRVGTVTFCDSLAVRDGVDLTAPGAVFAAGRATFCSLAMTLPGSEVPHPTIGHFRDGAYRTDPRSWIRNPRHVTEWRPELAPTPRRLGPCSTGKVPSARIRS